MSAIKGHPEDMSNPGLVSFGYVGVSFALCSKCIFSRGSLFKAFKDKVFPIQDRTHAMNGLCRAVEPLFLQDEFFHFMTEAPCFMKKSNDKKDSSCVHDESAY